MIDIKRILVATDFSEASRTAVEYGRALAEQFGSALHLVHVVPDLTLKSLVPDGFVVAIPDGLQRQLDADARNKLEALRAVGPNTVPVVPSVLSSPAPADAIVRYAQTEQIDLIVMGTRGRGGVPRLLLGSVAERVVRTAPCPVLTTHTADQDVVQPAAPARGAA
jgi:nucleotide-binding universal stress UspA family protein